MHILITLLALVLLPAAATAQEGVSELRLLPGWRMENGQHMAGIEVRLDPGWKTYWRRPGEAGIPPDFNWSGSDNVADVRVHWPVPEIFWQSGMRSVGYSEAVVLPIEITPARPGQDIVLRLTLDMGVCQDICIPVNAQAEAHLSPAPARPDARIRVALADRPMTEGEAGLTRAECDLRLTPRGAELSAHLRFPPLGGGEDIIFEPSDPDLRVSEPAVTRRGDTLSASVSLAPPRGQPMMLDRNRLKMTVIGSNGAAAEIVGCD